MITLPQQTLILFSGLPGCGKTTLARYTAQQFKIPLFAKDRFQRVLRDKVAHATAIDGYWVMMDQAAEQLSLGLSVILDAVFPKHGFRDIVRQMVSEYEARFRPVCCYFSDETLWRSRLANRVHQYVPDWEPVGWDKILQIRDEYEDWNQEECLHLDAKSSIARNQQNLVDYLCQVD